MATVFPRRGDTEEPQTELPHCSSSSMACTQWKVDFRFLPHITSGCTCITGVNSILKRESWTQVNVILNTHRKHICSKMGPFFIYNHFSGKNWILNMNIGQCSLDKAKIKRDSALGSSHFSSGTYNPSLLTLTIFRTLYIHTPFGKIRASHILFKLILHKEAAVSPRTEWYFSPPPIPRKSNYAWAFKMQFKIRCCH